MTRALILLTAAVLAACTVEHQVLLDDTILASCEQVWSHGDSGDRCDLVEQCVRDTPENETCCVDYAYCVMGELATDTVCDQECITCTDDHGCTAGVAVCSGMLCETCDQLPPDGSMTCAADCPPGWTYLTRNGCPTCECAPPSECNQNVADSCAPADPGGSQCYQGQRSADPACAWDDAGCFANVCAAPGCEGPAPAGCFTECRTMPECGQCATNQCTCDPGTGAWMCDEICVDEYPLALTCFL